MSRIKREKNQMKNKIINEMFRDEPRIEMTGNREAELMAVRVLWNMQKIISV